MTCSICLNGVWRGIPVHRVPMRTAYILNVFHMISLQVHMTDCCVSIWAIYSQQKLCEVYELVVIVITLLILLRHLNLNQSYEN